MFYTTKQDIRKSLELLLEQPDMFVSMVVYEGRGTATKSGSDVVIEPAQSPGWVVDALKSGVGLNLVIMNDSNHTFEGYVKTNDADTLTFTPASGKDIDEDVAGDIGDWTDDEIYDFYVMSPHEEYKYGDYFGVVKEPAFTQEEEMAKLEDPVEGLIAEGLIRVNMEITGVNYNVVNNDVLKAIRNLKEIGGQTIASQLYAGFRPDVRKKFRIAYAGRTDAGKDFLMVYFVGKFSSKGELAPNGTEYTSLPWSFTPYSDPIRAKDRNAYKISVQQ